VRSLKPGPAEKDLTLQNPHCVFQILKRHFARYTPEMVEQVCGSPKEKFVKVAELLLENSGRDRTSRVRLCSSLDAAHLRRADDQLLRAAPAVARQHRPTWRRRDGAARPCGDPGLDRCADLVPQHPRIPERPLGAAAARDAAGLHGGRNEPTSYYGNLPKFLVSYLKSMYGAAATAENDFGYDWHPKILGDHSHIATFAAMADGKVKGMCCVARTPRPRSTAGRPGARCASSSGWW